MVPMQAESHPIQKQANIYDPYISGAVPPAAGPVRAVLPKKSPLKIITAVVIAAVVVVVALAGIYLNHPKASLSVAYLKDKEIYYTGLSKIKPLQLTDNLYKNVSDSSKSEEDYFIRESKDGRTLFYPDELDTSDNGYTLYCRDVTDKSAKEGTKIDSGITSDYEINEAGTLVFYVRSDGSFYYSNKKDKNKIDSDVSQFYLNPDGSRVVYIKSDNSIYQQDVGKKKDKEKVDSDAKLLGHTKDLSTYYYSKDNDLYRKTFDKDEEKVTSDMNQFIVSFEDGTAYYTKGSSSDVSLYDYVEDDTAASDASITEPQYSDYETQTPTTDLWGYTYYTPQYDEAGYEKAYEAYLEKQQRDALRSDLKSETVSISNYTLYYYDGSNEVTITDNYDELKASSSSEPAVIYSVSSSSDPDKTKLSDITSASDFQTKISGELKSSAKIRIAAKTNDDELDAENASYFSFNSSGTAFYCLNNCSNDGGTLMEGKIDKDEPGSLSEVDDDVYEYAFPQKSDTLIYLKDMNNDSGDLYVNKTKVDSDVSEYVTTLENSSVVAYLTDYSDKSGTGTLKFYNGKASVKVADDVNSILIKDSSHLVYIGNYSSSTNSGDLFCYDGSSKVKTIDTDVSGILNPNVNNYK